MTCELERHAHQVNKYIVFHDTLLCGMQWIRSWQEVNGKMQPKIWNEKGEPATVKGIRPAIYEFLRDHPEWYLIDERQFGTGLMTITRR